MNFKTTGTVRHNTKEKRNRYFRTLTASVGQVVRAPAYRSRGNVDYE
jgi:hypothetical protein